MKPSSQSTLLSHTDGHKLPLHLARVMLNNRLEAILTSLFSLHVLQVVITSGTLSPIDLYPRILNFNPVSVQSFSMTLTRDCMCPVVVTRGADQVSQSVGHQSPSRTDRDDRSELLLYHQGYHQPFPPVSHIPRTPAVCEGGGGLVSLLTPTTYHTPLRRTSVFTQGPHDDRV